MSARGGKVVGGWSLSPCNFMGEKEADSESKACMPMHHGIHNPEKCGSIQKREKGTGRRLCGGKIEKTLPRGRNGRMVTRKRE